MSNENMKVKYTGSTPGADSDTYNLFTTITNDWPANMCAIHGFRKFSADIAHDEIFTMKWYKSNDRGTSWEQVGEQSIAIPSNGTSHVEIAGIEMFGDFKVDAVNGGTAQSPWDVDMSLIGERSSPS